MSKQNVELVHRVIEAFNRRDVEAAAALVPNARIVPLRAALEGVAYTGPNAFREFWADATDAWSQLSIEVERVTDLEERVLVIGRLRATARGSGAGVETPVGWVVTFHSDSVTEFRTYPSREAALEAVAEA